MCRSQISAACPLVLKELEEQVLRGQLLNVFAIHGALQHVHSVKVDSQASTHCLTPVRHSCSSRISSVHHSCSATDEVDNISLSVFLCASVPYYRQLAHTCRQLQQLRMVACHPAKQTPRQAAGSRTTAKALQTTACIAGPARQAYWQASCSSKSALHGQPHGQTDTCLSWACRCSSWA